MTHHERSDLAARNLRQDGATQSAVLSESFVERHQLVARSPSKGGEEGIIPDFGREGLALRVSAPEWLKVRWLIGEGDTRIAQEEVEFLPRFRQRHCVLSENARVCCQPQEPLLGQTAEETEVGSSGSGFGFQLSSPVPSPRLCGERARVRGLLLLCGPVLNHAESIFIRQAVKPLLGHGMVDVRVKRQRQPDVDIREQHLRHPESPRCVCWSDARCPADRNEPTAVGFAAWRRPAWPGSKLGTKRSRKPLPATRLRRQEPPSHSVLDREFPCRDSRSSYPRNQVPTSNHEAPRRSPVSDWSCANRPKRSKSASL